nr:methyltransferase domain-containing protein [Bacteroidota bacterium]
MITFSSTYRSKQAEIMDDFDLKGPEMKDLLTDLKRVNKLLGGNAVTLSGIDKLLSTSDRDGFTILDVGCGDGELLRQCAAWARKKGHTVKLIGIDANEHILIEAKHRSIDYPNISYQKMDVFSDSVSFPSFDVALCTLFLHHFSDAQVTGLLKRLLHDSKVGVVVNDLDRSYWAFQLFKVFSIFFIKTKIAKHDGLISIKSGFKKQDL